MLGDILTNILIVIAVASLLGYFTSAALRSRPAVDAVTGMRTYSYTRPYKALALISVVLPALMGVLSLSFYKSGESDYIVWLVISMIFAAVSAYLLLECFLTRIQTSEPGVTSISPWGGRQTFGWAEIHSISYSKSSGWYIITGPGGKKIRASEYLSGISELVAECRKRIPPEKWSNHREESVSLGGGRI